MPDMTQENYEFLLSKIEELNSKNLELENKVKDLSALQLASLNRREKNDDNVTDEEYKKYLDKKFERSFL